MICLSDHVTIWKDWTLNLHKSFSQERIWAQHSSAKCWPSLVFSFKYRMLPQVEIVCVCVWWSKFSKHKIRVILDSLPDVTASTIPRFPTVTQNTIQLHKERWECRLHHYHKGICLSSLILAALNFGHATLLSTPSLSRRPLQSRNYPGMPQCMGG